MNQDKVSELIKSIRIKNKMTQKEFSLKYGVTHQAVSKWETGKGLPDIEILKKICNDNNIIIDNVLEGNLKKKRNLIYIIGIVILFIITIIIILNNNDSFDTGIISSNCDNFNITGNISYNNKKTFIHISSINYCGNNIDKNIYKDIECNLYEKNNNKLNKISTYKSKNNDITLNEFLKEVEFIIDDYDKVCKKYKQNSLVMIINAEDNNNSKVFNIPLSINKCNKNT